MAHLEDKTVLVTAGAQGIGRASAIAFAAAGARVVATDINEALLADLPTSERLTTARLDVLDDEAVRHLHRRAGPRRCAVQLRRRRACRQHPRYEGRRSRHRDQPERQIDDPHHPRRAAGHARRAATARSSTWPRSLPR